MARNNLTEIKNTLDGLVGETITIRADKGRKRFVTRDCVLRNTYPSIFVVEFKNRFNKTQTASYTYSDVLTELVVLKDIE